MWLLALACAVPAAPVNRLGQSTSPYLLRHAADPVAWSPWDDAALARARAENKPIFLSIGYLSCHWCAVMHRESFLDPEIAALLNERFVPIKVDREERPDVDAAWLPVVRAAIGDAGWPMTLVLAPDLTPVFAATYLPARDGDRGSARGLLTVLRETADPDPEAASRGAALAAHLREARSTGGGGGLPDSAVCDGQRATVLAAADLVHGGFGRGSHFPQVSALTRLLGPAERSALVVGLDGMAGGGLRDHLRGGFFRYTLDPAWTRPHFEKMLVDQAGLAWLYTVAAERVPERRDAWRAVAAETLDFALGALRLPSGGFGTGLDAETAGQEGGTYLWTEEAPGWHLVEGLPIPDGATPVPEAWRALVAARPLPDRDGKQVAAWNGRMISALAVGGFALERPDFLAAAARAADAVLASRDGDGCLPRTPEGAPGQLEDQSLVGLGLLDLHAATGDPRWLGAARGLYACIGTRFAADGGGWWRTAADGFRPWGPERPVDDGPEPSGTAAGAELGIRLATLDGADPREVRLALERTADALREATFFRSSLCTAFDLLLHPPLEVVLATPPGTDDSALRQAAVAGIGPGWVLVRAPAASVALAADKVPIDGKPTAYVCTGTACDPPTTDPAALRARLLGSAPGERGAGP
jgi:uncharacterized protein YyaL (SSP411 family)